MALLNASDFTGFSDNYAIPSGVPYLILSTGTTQQKFDTLSTNDSFATLIFDTSDFTGFIYNYAIPSGV